ncbi:hypothetical protein OsJ_05963 [Oryza sativa Japonica Group]|uniref:Protein kinase domain-containing protein n=1 Tax=Oryza sativa subsp. japonica TaxID=39947 RepID=B9F4E3_ORYSJ|nr:hypothetical protein OsJ_05963 [Oryza sativa Japonica Group]
MVGAIAGSRPGGEVGNMEAMLLHRFIPQISSIVAANASTDELQCRLEETMLGIIRHDNIVVLRGSIQSDDDDGTVQLVYEDMENGCCLHEWLHGNRRSQLEAGERQRRRRLRWRARRSIAVDVARAICYLHHDCKSPIIHRDIKPTNILLDGNLKAKIAGFGLARINVAGLNQPLLNVEIPSEAFGYTAPEYATAQVNEKVDVYSFGVVLLSSSREDWRGYGRHLSKDVVDKEIVPDMARYLKEMKAMFKLGIGCRNGQVTSLSFHNFQIANLIPASICSLKNLKYLDLSFNNLTGEFPTALYSCSALQFLDLSNNEFTGKLPEHVDKLSLGMQHLNLSRNSFIGDLPSAIGRFSKLKSLVLDSNNFNGTYQGAAIGGLVELEMLTLAYNPFKASLIPNEFGKLTKLTYLWLSWMNLIGNIPNVLSALTELELLDISINKLEGKNPKVDMEASEARDELDLSINKLTGSIPEDIVNLKNLKILYLYYNNLVGQIPSGVGMLPNLTDLRLFTCHGVFPVSLGDCDTIHIIKASNNHFVGDFPEKIWSCAMLTIVMIGGNNFTGTLPS